MSRADRATRRSRSTRIIDLLSSGVSLPARISYTAAARRLRYVLSNSTSPAVVVSPFPSLCGEPMHDAGEKETPPSDRHVVVRKPLLPAPSARSVYRSARASEPGTILFLSCDGGRSLLSADRDLDTATEVRSPDRDTRRFAGRSSRLDRERSHARAGLPIPRDRRDRRGEAHVISAILNADSNANMRVAEERRARKIADRSLDR